MGVSAGARREPPSDQDLGLNDEDDVVGDLFRSEEAGACNGAPNPAADKDDADAEADSLALPLLASCAEPGGSLFALKVVSSVEDGFSTSNGEGCMMVCADRSDTQSPPLSDVSAP